MFWFCLASCVVLYGWVFFVVCCSKDLKRDPECELLLFIWPMVVIIPTSEALFRKEQFYLMNQ